MFTKKFLSLLLAVGLAFGLSSGVFAWKDSTVNVAESNTEIVKEFATMLTVPAAAKFFATYVCRTVIVTAIICEFCDKLTTYTELASSNTPTDSKNLDESSHIDNICLDILKMELLARFEYLYNNDETFKEAFETAWVKKGTGEPLHATQDGAFKRFRRVTGGRGYSGN
ncbi:MAG: hypothetical protein IJG00_02775 [Clostridia bacterium]|nr:hypothetical protein [Clostridia bacterium]